MYGIELFNLLPNNIINMHKSKAIWVADHPKKEWIMDITLKWYGPKHICKHPGLPLGVRITRAQKWEWAKNKMSSRFAKWNNSSLNLRGRGVVTTYGFMVAFNHWDYCIP